MTLCETSYCAGHGVSQPLAHRWRLLPLDSHSRCVVAPDVFEVAIRRVWSFDSRVRSSSDSTSYGASNNNEHQNSTNCLQFHSRTLTTLCMDGTLCVKFVVKLLPYSNEKIAVHSNSEATDGQVLHPPSINPPTVIISAPWNQRTFTRRRSARSDRLTSLSAQWQVDVAELWFPASMTFSYRLFCAPERTLIWSERLTHNSLDACSAEWKQSLQVRHRRRRCRDIPVALKMQALICV